MIKIAILEIYEIIKNNNQNPTKVDDLFKKTGLNKLTILQAIAKLKKQGFIKKIGSDSNRRSKYIYSP